MWHQIFLGSLLTLSSAQAAPVDCLVRFSTLGALSDDPEVRLHLIEDTFERLIDSAGEKISPEALRAMAESDDPFRPVEGDADLLALGRRLADFKGMLEEKGWLNPNVRNRLRARLKARADGVSRAEDSRRRTIAETAQADYFIEVSSTSPTYDFSPDGKLAILDVPSNSVRPGPVRLQIVDIATKATHSDVHDPGVSHLYGKMRFLSDPARLEIHTGKSTKEGMLTVPLTGLIPNWAKASSGPSPSQPSSLPKVREGLKVSELLWVRNEFGSELPQMKYAICTNDAGEGEVLLVEYDLDGKILTQKKVAGLLPASRAEGIFWTKGRGFLTSQGGTLYEWPTVDRGVPVVTFPKKLASVFGEIEGGSVFAQSDQAVAYYRQSGKERFAVHADLKTGEVSKPFRLPDLATDLMFSPDGLRLVVQAEGKIHLLLLQKLLAQ